jgi:hypothetical protein
LLLLGNLPCKLLLSLAFSKITLKMLFFFSLYQQYLTLRVSQPTRRLLSAPSLSF